MPGNGPPSFRVTPYGMLCHVPVATLNDEGKALIVLAFNWQTTRDRTSDAICRYGLAIKVCRHRRTDDYHDLYCVDNNKPLFQTDKWDFKTEWRDIYIRIASPFLALDSNLQAPVNPFWQQQHRSLYIPFRFLYLEHNWQPYDEYAPPKDQRSLLVLRNIGYTSRSVSVGRIYIYLDRCSGNVDESHPLGSHWAYVAWHESDNKASPRSEHPTNAPTSHHLPDSHNCAQDHIREWPLHTKIFHLTYRYPSQAGEIRESVILRLTFSWCQMNPSTTLRVHPGHVNPIRHNHTTNQWCTDSVFSAARWLKQKVRFFQKHLSSQKITERLSQ